MDTPEEGADEPAAAAEPALAPTVTRRRPVVPAPPDAGPTAPAPSRGAGLAAVLMLGCLLLGLVSLKVGPHEPTRRDDKEEYELFGPTDVFAGLRPEGVAVLRLDGAIMFEDPGFSGDKGADRIVKILRKISEASSVKAVVLRINSPGGTVAASQEIADAVKLVKKAGKKVVVSMADVCASGGYYVSAAADWIYANPGTITGSIGVITSLPRYKEIAEKIGYTELAFTSGAFKDMGNPFRELRDDEKALFEKTVMGAYLQFAEEVAQGRAHALSGHLEAVRDAQDWRADLERFRDGSDDRPLRSIRASGVTSGAAAEDADSGPAEAAEGDSASETTTDTASVEATPVTSEPAPPTPAEEPEPEVDMGRVRQRVAELADGRIYPGSEALRVGLVDELGGLREAIRKAGELSGLGPDPVLLKPKTGGDLGSFFSLMGKGPSGVLEGLRQRLQLLVGIPAPAPRQLPPHLPVAYLYAPGG